MNKKFTTIILARNAVIAALYLALTWSLAPISYGPLQIRVGEALTLMPILFPGSVIGLTVGCLIANILSPFGWADMVFGTIATLIAALLTSWIGKMLQNKKLVIRGLVGAVPPIMVNAIVLPLVWLIFDADKLYFLNFASILASQTATILIIGIPLIIILDKLKFFKS